MRLKASITAEAALLCPLLCLMICAMIQFTMRMYRTIDAYAKTVTERQEETLSSSELIRLEAVAEDIF